MTTALTQQQIDTLLVDIDKQKLACADEISQLEVDSMPVTLDQQSVGRVSRIDAIAQQQMALARISQIKRRQQALEKAAYRLLHSDDFGYCGECGELIPFERLVFNPTVALCVACASRD